MATATETLTGGSHANTAGGNGGASGGTTPSSAPGGGSTGGAGVSGLPGANQPAAGWWDSIKDADLKGWLSSKKPPDAEAALKSYWGMERLMGADKAGRTVMLPKDDADADGWKALSAKLGVPESADGYKLPVPEGADDGFSKTAAKWFHEAGVPPRAATKVAEMWNGWVAEQVKAGEVADKAASDKQMGALEQEWGTAFAEKRELAQRGYRQFAQQFGLDDKAALERAESALGAANLTKFFAGLGAMNGESNFVGGDRPGGFGITIEQAQKRLTEIRADRIAGKINDAAWRKDFEPEVLKLGKVIAGVRTA